MKPMLCQSATLEQARKIPSCHFERKLDGIRAYIENGKLYDRRGKEITHQFPEFVGVGEVVGTFDGEIISASGEFSDISGRVHLRDKFIISLSAKKSPAIFVVFDVVMEGTIEERRSAIERENLWGRFGWIQKVPRFNSFDEGWKLVEENGWEGLILKRFGSTYQEGARSPDWIKCKAFQEAKAIFTKLSEHPRGVRLETEDGRSVNVNGAQALEVKQRFEKEGRVLCEVQYLPQKGSDAWRFPSFRGLLEV